MKKITQKIIIVGTILSFTAITAITAAADTYKTPANALSELTGKSIAEVVEEKKDTGKTYGELASEAGVLDKFKETNAKIKKEKVDQKIDQGNLTREQGDQINQNIEKCQAICNGAGVGSEYGQGNGLCDGTGAGGKNQDSENASAGNQRNNANQHNSRGHGNQHQSVCSGTGCIFNADGLCDGTAHYHHKGNKR